jgi:hypothetical protein
MFLNALTDYPFPQLGDLPGTSPPVRKCKILIWDRKRYCKVVVLSRDDYTGGCLAIIDDVPSGFLYNTVVGINGFEMYSFDELDILPFPINFRP